MTTNDIDAIRQLTGAATPGPWEADAETVQVTGEVRYICEVFGLADKWPNAAFIAAARTLVPALCAEIEQLRVYAETTRYHQQQHAEAVREIEQLRAELAAERARTQETHQ